MGFDMPLCTSWLVCTLLLGFVHVDVAKQHNYKVDVPNLVQPVLAYSSSATANISSKFLRARNDGVQESFGLGQVQENHLPLLASPLQTKKTRYIQQRIAHKQTKSSIQMQLKNNYSNGQVWLEGWQDPPLSRHRREVTNFIDSNITSSHLSSEVPISGKNTAYHSDNITPSIYSYSLKPTETTTLSLETKIFSDHHSSINLSLATSNSNTASITLSTFLPDLSTFVKTHTQSSVNLIDTSSSRVYLSQSVKNISTILPTNIIPTPSVIPSSSIIPTPQLPGVDKSLNSFKTSPAPTLHFSSPSLAVLQPSMSSFGNTKYQSTKPYLSSITKSSTSLDISAAHVPTPVLVSPLLTNLSTSPIFTSDVLGSKTLNVSSTSFLSLYTNKILSSLQDQPFSVSISSHHVISNHNSLLPPRTNQNVNFTLGDQPTPQISAQTNLLSGTVPKSFSLPYSKAAQISQRQSASSLLTSSNTPLFLPFSSSARILSSSTLQTAGTTRLRINVTSTWHHPESARMVSPLSPLPRSKTTTTSNSTKKSTTKPKTNTRDSVTRKPGANYSLPQTVPEPELDPSPKSSSNTSRPDSEYTGDLLAEPVPDWEIAKREWKAAWEVHLYLFGILFAILSLYSVLSIVRLWHIKHLLSKHYFVVINLLIFFFCLLRTLFLLIDGYNSNRTFLPVIEYFLVSTGFPCLTSSFGVLFYALLNATKVQMLPVQIQRLPILISVILFHFLLSLSANILIAFFVNARILLFICQLFFILWGLFLFLGYIYAFRSLYSSAKKRQKSLFQLRQTNNQWESNYSSENERLTLSLGIKVTLLSAILGTVCACLQAYAALGVFSVFSRETPQPWPWWAYQTGIRFIEFLFCLAVAYVATQPFKYHSKYDCDFWFYFSSCIQLCQIKSVWNTSNDPSWNKLDDAITNTLVTQNGGRKEIKAAGYEIIPLTITLSTDAEISTQDPLENESMLVVQDGFVRFRTNEELEELRRSPRIPRMDLTDSKPSPSKPKTLQWGDNTSRGHQNGGFQSGDTLPGHMSPDCISTSTSPSTSQWNRISTTGSDLTFRLPSLSLADSIDKELEQYFRRSSICSERSLSSVRSSSMPGGIAMGSSDLSDSNSVFPSEGSPCGNGPMERDCLPDLDPTYSTKQVVKKGNVRNKLVNNVRYLSLDDLEKYPQNSSCGVRWKTSDDT